MNTLIKMVYASSILAFGMTVAQDSSARSASGWSGTPLSYANSNCFSESYGRVTNSSCNASEGWEVPLAVDAGGTWTVTVDITPTSDLTGASCVAFGLSQDGGTYWVSSTVSPTVANAAQTEAMSVNVPSGGYLYAACFLKEGARLNSINWNQ